MLASIPSPSTGVLHVGPFPLRAYAGCILLGVLIAVYVGDRRWRARGGQKGLVADVASVCVPTGLLGARIYHVITSPDLYLRHPIDALYIWHGGLGIWGGVIGGAAGAAFVLRRRGLSTLAFGDAIAPGVALAQAVGRFGNYFNQELFGRPTSLPWGLRIDPQNRPAGFERFATFHPTFLYESLWDIGVAVVVLLAERRFDLGRGRAFALYVATYTVGRAWIEALRIDDAHRFFGLRLNDYVAVVVFLGAVAFLVLRRGGDPREAQADAADVPSVA